MKKAVYQNPKTTKLYSFIDHKDCIEVPEEKSEILTVFDDKKQWDNAEFKVDKKGRAYKVLFCELFTLKNGFRALRTVTPDKKD